MLRCYDGAVKKLLVFAIIFVFFAPVLRPLAHSEGPVKVCSLDHKGCHHVKSRLDSQCPTHSSHHHHMEAPKPVKKGGHEFKCGCAKNAGPQFVQFQEEPFIIISLPMPYDSTVGPFAGKTAYTDSNHFTPVLDRPPAV